MVGAGLVVGWYVGLAFADKRFLITDERGSVIAGTNSFGATLFKNVYERQFIAANSNSNMMMAPIHPTTFIEPAEFELELFTGSRRLPGIPRHMQASRG